jgi:PAS domain S-box-containing protein
MRILLVEDNPADAELVFELLSEYPQYSFSVRHELSLGSARTALDDEGTDLILLDLGLPDSQGMETVRELRVAAQGTPIVVLTGLDDEDVGIRALHEGAQDYLAKGRMNGPALIRSIRYAEERNRIRADLTRSNAELAASREELRESEEKFRLLADFTADWESWTGADGECIYVSPSCERISGWSAEEFYREPELFATLVHPADRAAYEEHLKLHFTRDGGRESIDLRIVTAGGETRWISHHCRPIFGPDGSWLGRRISNRDVTRRKLAEEALRRSGANMAHAQRTAHLGNWEWDLVTNVVSCSDEHCRIYGLSPGDYPIETFIDLVHEDDREVVMDTQPAMLKEGTSYSVEYRVVRPDGSMRFIHGEGEAIRDPAGRVTGMFGIAQDITEWKEAELRVAQYAVELARSNEELQRFAYVASHDLQEPLRSIISFSQLLERRYRGQLDEDADDYIQFIVEGGNRMQALIRDLLQLSRVETQAKPLRPTDAAAVVASVLRVMETGLAEAGATVEVGDLPAVMADEAQLVQVFANLIGNAIKYRRADIAPVVRVEAWRVGPMVQFSVADNGIGIEKEYFDRIFEMFRRLHTHDEYDGTGIGLAVVKKILERHGGKVWVESAPGEGSTFYFTLPAA